MELNLTIPFKTFKAHGGPATFMRNLQSYVEAQGMSLKKEIGPGTSIFFPVAYDLSTLKQVHRFGGRIIQRLDGVYYPSKHGLLYFLRNRKIKSIYRNYTDFFVFQSEYSKRQCEYMFGPAPAPHALIVNGVDTEIFHPGEQNESRGQLQLITTGVFRNEDMICPVIEALDQLTGRYDFNFNVLGPISNDKVRRSLNRPYVRHLGETHDPEKIANQLRSADLFIYSHLNPPCPNSVVEAIACGLPVIGFDSGSMLELCPHQPELLAKTPEKILHGLKDFDPSELVKVLELGFTQLDSFRQKATRNAPERSLSKMGAAYLEVFQRVCAGS